MFTQAGPDALPAAIAVDELFDGVRYRLPPRELGGLRWLGLAPILFGVGVAATAVSFVLAWSGGPFDQGGDFDWFSLIFLAFTLPFLYAALKLSKIGLYVIAGHSEIELRAGELCAIERVGPLKWVRKRPLESVSRFKVVGGPGTKHADSRLAAKLTGLAGIVAECDSAKQMALAVLYPEEWLVPLANDLAERWDLIVPDRLTGARRPAVEVTEGVLSSSRERERVDERDSLAQPAASAVQVDEHTDGVTLSVPPAGTFKGSKGLVWFGLAFTAFPVGIFVPAFVLADDAPWAIALFLLAFSSIGVAILLAAINMGRRRAVLAVVGDRLMVMQAGLFGAKRREWARADVKSIGVGPSGLSINDRPVLELQVHPNEGSKFALLAGRDAAELRWMATVMRRALGVSADRVEV